MKRYVYSISSKGSKFETYNGVPIYKDAENYFYIYKGKYGTDKMEFVDVREARQYIDDELGQEEG